METKFWSGALARDQEQEHQLFQYENLSERARCRYQCVHGLRMMTLHDMTEIIARTPRRLGSCVRVVVQEDLVRERQLKLGHGMLLLCHTRFGGHAVAVFRSLDGKYIYYDPLAGAPNAYFEWFLFNNQVTKGEVLLVPARLQHEGIGTCAYHSITFLEYVTSSTIDDHVELVSSFISQMGPNTELTAVFCVKLLLSEFYTHIDLTFGKHAHDLNIVYKVVEDDYPEQFVDWNKRHSNNRERYPSR